jgi:hypothetical protein
MRSVIWFMWWKPRPSDVAARCIRANGKFVLLAPDAAAATMDGWQDRVVLVTPADTTTPWTLVRPDGHIAWRGGPATLCAGLLRAGQRAHATVE